MTDRTYTVLHLACGLGGCAVGFQAARGHYLGDRARFRTLAGIDCDEEACADFTALTGAPAVRADLAELTPEGLLAAVGGERPDVVFSSPPCKGFSGLLSGAAAAGERYQKLNRLVLQSIWLVLETWRERPPRLLVLENVPRITSRGAELLAQLRALLVSYGYRVHESAHDCGELGGLAQHRRRFLLIARHERQVPVFVYQPPHRRVRAIGEVLGELPLPDGPAAGPLHRLPRLTWKTWVRLALIPAGGDWRDLPTDGPYAVVADPEAAARFKGRPGLMAVGRWGEPTGAVTGTMYASGGNAVAAVADPRLPDGRTPFRNVFRMVRWGEAAGAVTAGGTPGGALLCVSDPRVEEAAFRGVLGVRRWSDVSGTITGAEGPTTGAFCIADPRLQHAPRRGAFRVVPFSEPAPTVIGGAGPGRSCVYAVADPRLDCAPRNGTMGVLDWQEPATTVTAAADVHAGSAAVADPRLPADTDRPDPPPVIVSADGTWHRPLTLLERAALQGLPLRLPDGSPLRLAGPSSTRWGERIGNAVPPPAARAVGEALLVALMAADAGATFVLGGTDVWVREAGEELRA